MSRSPLESLLESGGPGEILLLGEADYFTEKEIRNFLERRGLSVSREYTPATVAALEGRRLWMPEELMSEQAYSEGISHYRLEELERIISRELRPDEVLMALKLGSDTERLLRLLRNEYLANDFFLRLLRLYRWEGEELMESDRDRAVLIALMERFLDLNVYERDALHSPVTLLRLIRQTDKAELLEALLEFPAFAFRLGRGERISIPEAVATREILNPATVKRLLRRREPEIDRILAANPVLSPNLQRHLLEQRGDEVAVALAANPALAEDLFERLLQAEGEVPETLLHFQPVDLPRLDKILKRFGEEGACLTILGENRELAEAAAERLAALELPVLCKALAANESVPSRVLESLAHKEDLHPLLARNPSTPKALLEKFFASGKAEVLEGLAGNPSTPEPILEKLYARGDFGSLQALAANPATPMEILHELKTDHRLWLILQRNEKFVREANREMGMR